MRRRSALLALLLALLLLGSTTAFAEVSGSDREPALTIQQVTSEPDGTTRMTVQVTGLEPGTDVALERLEVLENGEVVEDLRLVDSEAEQVDAVTPALVIALDTSGSTQGEPIAAAKAAASDLVEMVTDAGAVVGVVGFGESTETIAPLSSSPTAALAGIEAIVADGGTALRDGVARAARILASHDGPRDVVVFSDGEDTTSQSSLDGVRALLSEAEVRVTSVVLRSESFALEPLEALANVNEGRLLEVEEASQLGDAFAAIAGDLTNRLDVIWNVEPVADPPRMLNVTASYDTGEVVVSDGAQIESTRLAAITPPREVDAAPPLVGAFAGEPGLTVATVGLGLAAFLLLFLILAGAGQRRRRHALDDRLAAYQSGPGGAGREDHRSISERASSAFDAVPRPANLDSRIAASIEKADWPLRVSEFLLLTIGAALLGVLLGGVLFGSLFLAVMGALAGLGAPWAYLQVAVSQRQAAFADQLPTVLQVLAGALRAGHGFSTALASAVDEVDEPAKSELRRASVEGRLGRPLDRALVGVADRMDSEDLQWVVGALEVQREVGGNLAEILGNVAETLRDRASLARHVKALTAEGRLSAVFISAMPFVMFGYLSLTNPDYVRPLFADPVGRLMMITGLVLLVIGVVVLRRLVRPKY